MHVALYLFSFEPGVTVFGREHDMQVDLCERLSHGNIRRVKVMDALWGDQKLKRFLDSSATLTGLRFASPWSSQGGAALALGYAR